MVLIYLLPRWFLPTSVSLNLPCCPSMFRVPRAQKQVSVLNIMLLKFLTSMTHGQSECWDPIRHPFCAVGQSEETWLRQDLDSSQLASLGGDVEGRVHSCPGSVVLVRECLLWKRHIKRLFPLCRLLKDTDLPWDIGTPGSCQKPWPVLCCSASSQKLSCEE